MPIPDYQAIMLPLLKFASDGKEHTLREALDALALQFKLTDQERKQLLPSGTQATFNNRTAWARSYMGKAGLLHSPKRGSFIITERGREVLAKKPSGLNAKLLEQFPEFVTFKNLKHGREKDEQESEALETPEETLETGYQRIRESLAQEILDKVKAASPSFFERLVVDLLVKMGYGGSRRDAGEAIGQSGDGGIDGIIKEDRLGLDILYIQAKRWEGNVSRPEIQKFVGALQGKHARKGIFLTTSSFSKEAHEFVKHIETKIVLIDGVTLAGLMVDHGVGTSTAAVYEIKKVDQDYFAEE